VARFTVQNYYTIVNPSVGIAVTGAKDAIGNAQADYSGGTDVFEVNTAATAPLASVTGVVPSAPVVTTANLGKPVAGQWTTGFVERITYDQSMAGYSPVVTLTANDPTQQQALNNTLSFDAAWSWWVSDTTFRAAFDVADSGFSGSAAGFTIHVKWARSNTFPYYDEVRYSGPANFSIDTQRPTVVSVTQSSRPQILSLTVVYSKAMQGTAPTFGFGGPIFGEIGTFVPYGGWWTSSTTYVETFLVLVDGPFPLSNLYIWGARDLDGNVQVGYPGDFMPLDTLGPGQTSLTDAVLSSGALNLSVGTSTTSMDDQQSAINPIDKALALTGTWLDV
jgi:hypothetical protein